MRRARTHQAALLMALLGLGCARAQAPPGIRIGLVTPVVSFDPHATNDVVAFSVNWNVYDSLVSTDENLRPVPRLAARWFNPDDRTWTFDLVPGVRFHDGAPFASQDAAFSLQRARSDPLSEWGASLQTIEAVETPTPSRLVVRTRVPDPTLLQALAQVLIVGRGSGAIAQSRLKLHPTGTGPYRLDSYHAATETIELTAWEGYWGRRPALARVAISAITDARARSARLMAGELDLVTDVPQELTATLAASPDLRIIEQAGLVEVSLGFDVARGRTPYASPTRNPFRDPRVRRAFQAAIDKARLVRDVLGGSGEESHQLVARSVLGWDREMLPQRADPALARRLLAEAGLADGFSVVLDGPATSFVCDERVAPFLARSLAQVGVRVDLRLQAKPELFRRYAERDTSLFLAGWNSTTGDEQEVLDFVFHTPDAVRGYGSENSGGYSNPRLDAIADQARRSMRFEDRLRLLRAAARVALDDVAQVPLYVPRTRYGLRRQLRFAPRPDQFLRVEEMRFAR